MLLFFYSCYIFSSAKMNKFMSVIVLCGLAGLVKGACETQATNLASAKDDKNYR